MVPPWLKRAWCRICSKTASVRGCFSPQEGRREPTRPSPASLTLTLHDGADHHSAHAFLHEALLDLGYLGIVGAQDGDALRQDGAI